MNIRGHHLFCTYCFYGSGKKRAEDFFGIKNAIPELLRKLQQNSDMEITIKTDIDDVCDICPLKRPDVSKFCTNCSSASPSGWKEYQIGIRNGFWPEKE